MKNEKLSFSLFHFLLFLFLLLTAGCFRPVAKNDPSLLNEYAVFCIQKGLWTEAGFYLERANLVESAATCNF